MEEIQGKVLICLESYGLFVAGTKYYCFAEEDEFFWIHAPFLLDRIGVDQIKVSRDLTRIFCSEENYHPSLLESKNHKLLS